MTVLKVELKNLKRILIAWCIFSSLVLFAMISFFPEAKVDTLQQLAYMINGEPPTALVTALLYSQIPDFSKITPFFAYILSIVNIAIAVFAALLGTNMLVKEENDGTIQYLYAQPLTRFQIALQKLFANVIAYAVLVIVLAFVSVIALLIYNDSVAFTDLFGDIALFFPGSLFAGLVFLCLGFLFSAIIRTDKQAASIAIGLVFGTYITGEMSQFVSSIRFLRFLSPIETVNPVAIMVSGFNSSGLIFGIFVVILSVILGFILYLKKDFKE